MLYDAVGWCGAKPASVYFRKMNFCLFFSEFFEIYGAMLIFKLYFPIKKRDWPKFSSALGRAGCRKFA